MAYSGLHNPGGQEGRERPNPDGWKGGAEDFETIWTLKGHKLASTDQDTFDQGKTSRNHQRLYDADGFC